MPRKKQVSAEHAVQSFDREWLLAHKDFGPAIIGQEAYEAAQSLVTETGDGVFGPALIATEPLPAKA